MMPWVCSDGSAGGSIARWWLLPFLWLGAGAGGASAQEAPALRPMRVPTPLFLSDDVIDLTIEGPLTRVFLERDEEEKLSYDVVVRYHAPGAIVPETHDVELRTRGRFRLRETTCAFPPLRLHFDQDKLDRTIFAGQHRVKIVTHCRTDRPVYEQYVLREYLVYRLYNLFTEESFRARLARITYIDTDSDGEPITRYAFLLEDADDMAARNGYDELEVPGVVPDQIQQEPLVRFELFQLMIGNTDWDPYQPEPGDVCCHNTVPIGSLREFIVLPVPYDFDFSGLVNAEYAVANPRLLINSVRQRRYWGVCRSREQIDAALPQFLERRQDVYDLVRSIPGLTPASVDDAIEYLDEFFDIIADPRRVEREIVRRCRELDY